MCISGPIPKLTECGKFEICIIYLVWKQTASSAARHTCSFLEYCVRPTMAPRASGRHRGAYRPEKLKCQLAINSRHI